MTEAERSTGAVAAPRSAWLVWLPLALAALLLYFALRDVDWTAFWQAIRTGRFEFLLLTIPLASLSYAIRGIRWSVLVRSEAKVPVVSVFWANMIGYMGNAFLPARAGELLRSAYLGRWRGLGTSFVLATALTERILDAVTLVIVGAACLLTQGGVPPALAGALRLAAVASLVALVILIWAPSREDFVLRLAGRVPLPTAILARVTEQAARFLRGMRSLRNARRLVAFSALTGAVWTLDALGSAIGAQIVSRHLSPTQALILLAAMGLSSAIPSTPGYIGVYQFVAVAILPRFGFTPADALAYILISQVVNYLVVGVWGLLGLWQMGRAHEQLEPGNDPPQPGTMP